MLSYILHGLLRKIGLVLLLNMWASLYDLRFKNGCGVSIEIQLAICKISVKLQ